MPIWWPEDRRWYPNLITLKRWSWFKCQRVMWKSRLLAWWWNVIRREPSSDV
jgi:hypothetical protein